MTETKQETLLKIARSFIGTPYKYAVQTEEIPKFFDCSSFTQYVFKQIGVDLPRSSILQATVGEEVSDYKNLEIGDLIFYRGTKGHYNDELFSDKKIYIGHVVLYSGENKVIHAASMKGITEENLDDITEKRGPIVIIKRL